MSFDIMLVCLTFLLVGGLGLLSGDKTHIWGKLLLTFLTVTVIGYLTLWVALFAALSGADFYAIITLVYGMLLLAFILCSIWGAIRIKMVWIPLCSCLVICALVTVIYALFCQW